MKKPEKLEKKNTNRGLGIIEFKDRNGHACSLQESSIATEACIWLGVEDNALDPQIIVAGSGWQPVPFPPETLFHSRMHLTQEQVKSLLPHLKKFVKTGSL